MGSHNVTRAGWVIGAGIESALGDNWSVKVEYLHVDLGTITASGGVTTQGSASNATLNFSTKVTSDLVRVGAAYKF